jgi:hypothetical protein
VNRLSDAELDEAFEYAHGSLRLTAALSELKERRKADEIWSRLDDLAVRTAALAASIHWPLILASNLLVAAALCKAYWLGYGEPYARRADLQRWEPGCGVDITNGFQPRGYAAPRRGG